MAQVVKIFVGGGGDDWFSHIVEQYASRYAERNPDFICEYFSWTDGRSLKKFLRDKAKDASITVVGHSYGADTAFNCIGERTADVLVSIDPVASFRNSWASIRPHCRVWLNVRAEKPSGQWDRSDWIAMFGGKYGRPPVPGQPGAPDHAHIAPVSHGEFAAMMRDGAVSGRMLLGGRAIG